MYSTHESIYQKAEVYGDLSTHHKAVDTWDTPAGNSHMVILSIYLKGSSHVVILST